MADKLLERLQRCSTRTSWPCRLAPERPPGLARRAFASGSAFGCFRHRLQAAAVLAASSCAPRWCTAALSCLHFTHMRGQSSVHADCLKKRWGAAYPASVTPQAGKRSAHLAAPSKLQKTLRPSTCQSDFHFRNYVFSARAVVTKPHLFRYGSVSLRAAAARVGRLGRRLAPRALLIFQATAHQHDRLNASLQRTSCISKYQ